MRQPWKTARIVKNICCFKLQGRTENSSQLDYVTRTETVHGHENLENPIMGCV